MSESVGYGPPLPIGGGTITGTIGFGTAPIGSGIVSDGAGGIAIQTAVPAPTAATIALQGSGAGNCDNGTHSVKVTFVTASGESQASAKSNVLTVADKTVNGQILVSPLPTGPTGVVTGRNIYMSAAGDAGPWMLIGASPSVANNTAASATVNVADLTIAANAQAPAVNTTQDNHFDFTQTQLLANSGTQALPTYSFLTAPTTGMYLNGAFLSIGAGGVQGLFLSSTTVASGLPIQINGQLLTAGTLTATSTAKSVNVLHRYDWTNAMVVALGAVTTGNITAFTLPAKAVVVNAYIVVNTAAGGTTTLTASLGRTGAAFTDYIVASDVKAAANTIYGNTAGTRGTNLTGFDVPAVTGTTAITLQFVSTGANLSAVTTSTGYVEIETYILL